jgi:3-hydroxyisobutyrate/3-hydroxypropionate dehydrogenase
MGYPMAINLRSGIDKNTKLLICDVSEDALSRFQKQTEGKGPVEVVKNGYEAVQQAVRSNLAIYKLRPISTAQY